MYYIMNFGDLTKMSFYRVAEIHVLGSDLWRGIGLAPFSPYRATYSAFLNGFLHWDCDDDNSMDYLVSFDFVSERFGKIPPPPGFRQKQKWDREKISLGIMGEYLYLCDAYSMKRIDVWLMKEYGIQESWSKDYVIDKYFIDPVVTYERKYCPVKVLRNGEMLMVYPGNYLICFDPVKKSCRFLKFREVQSQLEVIFHTPSFASLKDVVIGGNAKVLNLRPRSEVVVVGKETETLFLGPEEDSKVEVITMLFIECMALFFY